MQARTTRISFDGDTIVTNTYAPDAPTDALPVLLIHGWGGTSRYWRDTITRLGEQFPLVVPDMPGAGRSLPVRRPRDMFDQVDAIEALLDQLNVSRAHVVGHSMGGGLAMLLAAKRPEFVERLVLTAICLFRNDGERAFFNTMMGVADVAMRLRAPWMADLPFLARQSARRYFYRVPDDADLLRDGLLDYLEMDHATAVASARSAASPAIHAAAARIQAPTLLVTARQDRAMPIANVDFTAQVIPHCTVRWIEECGHLPMIEKPDEYADILRAFLADAPAPADDRRPSILAAQA